jgi:hypothetical protein
LAEHPVSWRGLGKDAMLPHSPGMAELDGAVAGRADCEAM